MAIFRGVGGSGDSSDNSFLQEVTAQANAAARFADNAFSYSLLAAEASSSILNLTAATGAAGTEASYDASTGVLTIPRGDTGVVDTASVSAAGAAMLTGADFTGNVTLADDDRLKFGDGDLQIYHSASSNSSFITEHGTGGLIIRGEHLLLSDLSGKDYLRGTTGGTTGLYHNGFIKFNTKDYGIDVTGNITVSGTVDGVDIATRDGVLTSTTTTADNALPKAGGQMTGNITFSGTQTVDGRDVSVDGAKLDTLERVYRRRFLKHAYNYTTTIASLTSSYSQISPTIRGTTTTGSENELDLHITAIHYDINTANEFIFYVNLVAPYAPAEDTVNLGTVSDVSGTTTSIRTFAVSGDITKHLSPYCGMSTTSTGANAFGLDNNHSWYYDSVSNKTIMTTYNYQSNLPSNGDTLYLHPFDWESSGTQLTGDFYPVDAYNASGTVNIRRDHKLYLGYHKNAPQLSVYARETTSSENIAITALGGVLTQYQD